MSYAYGVSSTNQAVGVSPNSSLVNNAFYWTQGDGIVDLGVLATGKSGGALLSTRPPGIL